jgi:hypothetical protein
MALNIFNRAREDLVTGNEVVLGINRRSTAHGERQVSQGASQRFPDVV